MIADYVLLLAAVALVLLGLLAGDWLMEALAKKGWLLKIAERLGIPTKTPDEIADMLSLVDTAERRKT